MSLGYTYIRATDKKLYRNPEIETPFGVIFFDDGDPEILVVCSQKQTNRMRREERNKFVQAALDRFFESVHQVVKPRRCAKPFPCSDKAYWSIEVDMNKRVPAELISKHEGVFDSCPGEGTYPVMNG